ncbi:DUF1467 family protein [Porphyrobacter algicida]|uniref:DUF1467 family protein n=1 Tax=Qipengyuania algicida TaxID=1836209 RepID=A0A845AE82_9SPHN|nr:DUF1467 family protein [Qipengyuania algicida]MXP28550.1 DUF1467 family protein [Qipengyuania algicida]
MQLASFLAVYFLCWVMSALILLPFGIRTHDELGMDKIAGQADSAPGNFSAGRVAIRATIMAAVLTAIFFVNYHYGWVGLDDLDFSNWIGM